MSRKLQCPLPARRQHRRRRATPSAMLAADVGCIMQSEQSKRYVAAAGGFRN